MWFYGECFFRSDGWCFPMMSQWGGCFLIKERLPLWAWRGHCWPQFLKIWTPNDCCGPGCISKWWDTKNRDDARQINISNEFWLPQCWDTPIFWTAPTMSSLERGAHCAPFPAFSHYWICISKIFYSFLFVKLFPRILTTHAKKCASHLDVQPGELNRDNIIISTMFGHDNIQTWSERDGVMTTNKFCFCVLLLFPSHTDNLRSEHWSGTCTLGSWKNCGRNLPDLMWAKDNQQHKPLQKA